MTYHDPYHWPQPDHLPRHAAAPRLLRPSYQRALRLLVAAGIAAAGLCLVIGAVALVAATGAPSRGATLTPTAHQSAALRSDQAGAGGGRAGATNRSRASTAAASRTDSGGSSPARPALLLGLAGDGSEVTRRFRLVGPGSWQLSWSYHDCRGPGPRRTAFLVTDGSATGIDLAGSGPAGHGATSAYADPGWHHLVIRSGCSWAIRVTGPR